MKAIRSRMGYANVSGVESIVNPHPYRCAALPLG